jgi:hypothetical protein
MLNFFSTFRTNFEAASAPALNIINDEKGKRERKDLEAKI